MSGKQVGMGMGVRPSRAKPLVRSRTARELLQCLVVSVSAERRGMFASAATQEGWQTIGYGDVPRAGRAIGRTMFQLALIDLDGTTGRSLGDLRSLTEQLGGMAQILIVLCGHDGDSEEEIWARELGAWLYLPGVCVGDDMTMVCREAMLLARRLSAVSVPSGDPLRARGRG